MAIHSILVTGGAGYIGSHLVDRLCSLGLCRDRARQPGAAGASDRHVAVVRQSRRALRARRRPGPRRVRTARRLVRRGRAFRRGGQRGPEHVPGRSVRGREHARHRAAPRHPRQREAQRAEGARGLLDRCLRRRRVPVRRLRAGGAWHPVRPSSWRRATGSSTARSCGAHVVSMPTPEDKALYRDNIYSMTKYHQEEMVLLIGKTYGIPAVAPRFFNVYGPRQSLSNPYAGVAAIWLSRLHERQAAGGVRGRRAASGFRLDPRRRRLPGADAGEVGRGLPARERRARARSSRSWTSRSCSLGCSAPRSSRWSRKPGGSSTSATTPPTSRARETTLGFEPKVTLEQGFSELIEWAKTTPDVAEDFFDRALRELQDKGLLVTGTATP